MAAKDVVPAFNPAVDKLADYMSFSEAAEQLGVRFQQVYQRYERGKLPGTKQLFGKLLVSKRDLASWDVARKEYFAKTHSK